MSQTSRGARGGRGGNAKKPSIMPNIAAAGRLEDSATGSSAQSSTSSRGRGRARRSEGRGRGRGGGNSNQDSRIIKSEGVFSKGFAEADKKGSKRRAVKGEETIIGKLEDAGFSYSNANKSGLKEDGSPVRKIPRTKPETSIYEELWQVSASDEEADQRELEDEFQLHNFIADIKKCEEVPTVLPVKDSVQFKSLQSKKARHSDESSSTSNQNNHAEENDVSCLKPSHSKIKEELFSDTEEPKAEAAHSSPRARAKPDKCLAAGETIRRVIKGKDCPFLLFQLPSSLSRISETIKQSAAANGPVPISQPDKQPEDGPSRDISKDVSMLSSAPSNGADSRHCLDGFPTGAEIGRLQLLKSGRVVMKIGGHQLDVSEAIPSGCLETAVRIETEAPVDPPSSSMIPSSSSASNASRREFINGLDIYAGSSPGTSSSAISIPSAFHRVPSNTNRLMPFDPEPPTGSRNQLVVLGDIPHQMVCSFNFAKMFRDNS